MLARCLDLFIYLFINLFIYLMCGVFDKPNPCHLNRTNVSGFLAFVPTNLANKKTPEKVLENIFELSCVIYTYKVLKGLLPHYASSIAG